MITSLPTLKSLPLSYKQVLLRTDYNVSLEDGHIRDDSRISATLPTIQALLDQKCCVIILSHLGRPDGKIDPKYSLKPIFNHLKKLFGSKTHMHWCSSLEEASKYLNKKLESEIVMIENLRFHAEEERNDLSFAKKLASLGDVYINDAFSVSHRSHASVEGLPKLLPHAMGYLFEKELNALGLLLQSPKHPLMAILGGAKISTKLDLIHTLVEKVNIIALGGGMANTFLLSQGYEMGASLTEPTMINSCKEILKKANDIGCTILLPEDVVATEGDDLQSYSVVKKDSLKKNQRILDIGPKTTDLFCHYIDQSKTLIWNGPMGLIEVAPYDKGSIRLASYIAKKTSLNNLISICGGGETASIIQQLNLINQFTYVSMAGGAFLEFLEGKKLPGVMALNNKNVELNHTPR